MKRGDDWWDRDPAWRDAAFRCTSEAGRCQLCGMVPRSLHAIPVRRSDPYGELLAVCGQCKVAARKYDVVPDELEFRMSIGPVTAAQITNTIWRRAR